MPTPAYTYRTPDAYTLHPATPPRKDLTGLTAEQRTQVHAEHTRAWRDLRTQGLGSSDASTILGVNPYGSLVQIYANKTTGHAPTDNDRMRLGRDLEDLAARRFTEETGIPVRRSGILANREQPWIRATPDRLTGDGGGLEIKTTTERDGRHQWDDNPSDHSMAQAQWSMAATGLHHWHIVVLFRDTGKFLRYLVERDNGLIETLILRASEFWHGNILQRCPPALDGTEATLEATRSLHPDADTGTRADGGEKAAVVRRRLSRIQAQKKLLDQEERQAKAEMLAMTGSAEELYANGVKVATARANGTFRAKDYTTEHPEAAARYMRTVEKLDHKAALAHDPNAAAYVPRVLRPSKTDPGFTLDGSEPEPATRTETEGELAGAA